MDVASGKVITDMIARDRSAEFKRFSNLNHQVPDELGVHVIVANSSHKTPAAQGWLVRHPRSSLHSTPPAALGSTSSSGGSLANQQAAAPGTHRSARNSQTLLGGHVGRQSPSFI
jgi:hypothetical protein